MLKSFFVILLPISLALNRSKIDPSLHRVLRDKDSANVFVSFKTGTTHILSSIDKQRFDTRGDKISAMRLLLIENAAESQKGLLQFLKESFPGFSYERFWINNQVYIKGATLELTERIAAFPEVALIIEAGEFRILHPPSLAREVSRTSPNGVEWGINRIQAPEAWGLDGGNDGANVRVATIDSGVRGTHEALRDNFQGSHGWFDPYDGTDKPNDESGHGTHVTGTIVGQGGIGVAPGATWLSCKGCFVFQCLPNALLKCGEFVLCPTDPKGENPDCSQAPHLVSNSWGRGQGDTMFDEVVEAWKIAGIIPLFANGNSGPECGSANSPADNPDVIAVGSTTIDDTLSDFSSVGPSVYGSIKPDIIAPGTEITSAHRLADDAYMVMNGTSMACPHVAGVVALLKGRNRDLSFADVKRHLIAGTERNLSPTGQNCGGVAENTWPNNAFGHGRVNALRSLLSLMQEI